MYQPKFNSVLVEIDDKDGEWGGSGDDSVMGKSFHKGKLITGGEFFPTADYPEYNPTGVLPELEGKTIIWNEGAEAGTTFEHEGKLYGFIYWYDIRGVEDGK